MYTPKGSKHNTEFIYIFSLLYVISKASFSVTDYEMKSLFKLLTFK